MTRDETVALFLECEAKRAEARTASLAESKSPDEAEAIAHEAAKAHWNAWAEPLLAERQAMKADGRWAAEKDWSGSRQPKNKDTGEWLDRARAVFSNCYFLPREAKETNGAEATSPNEGNPLDQDETIAQDATRAHCNVWAEAMLDKRKAMKLEECWEAGEGLFGRLEPFNEETRARVEKAGAVFSRGLLLVRGAVETLVRRAAEIRRAAELAPGLPVKSIQLEANCAQFGGFVFPGATLFERTAFKGGARFDAASFHGPVRYHGATFGTTFLGGDALFDRATFTNTVWFDSASFKDNARFNSVRFEGDVRFDSAAFGTPFLGGDAEFNSATFNGTTQFDNASFKANARFDGATFKANALFNSTAFGAIFQNRDARFCGATFGDTAQFNRAVFKSGARFEGTTFKANALFESTTFGTVFQSRGAGFDSATFDGTAWFHSAVFCGDARFDSATFKRSAKFNNATFGIPIGGDARFASATFKDDACFDGATFKRDALFDGTPFGGPAGFDRTTFKNHARFRGTTFNGPAQFHSATFQRYAQFDSATFSGNAWFESATFNGDARFDSATFTGNARFVSVHFFRKADFNSIKSHGAFSLIGAQFQRRVPDFLSAKFAEPVLLDNLRLSKDVEPGGLLRSMFGGLYFLTTGKVDAALSAKYRTLKRLAIQSEDHKYEQIFFRGELRARRLTERKLSALVFDVLFELTSDFGHSILRPVFCLILLSLTSSWYYLGQYAAPDVPVALHTYARLLSHLPDRFHALIPALWPEALPALSCKDGRPGDPAGAAELLAFKKSSVFAAFDTADKGAQIYGCLYGIDPDLRMPVVPDAVVFWGIWQTVLSAALLFLFLLALRNHFKIK